MWLLDVNLPNGLVSLLGQFGIKSETTVVRGWRNLGNGDLAEVASKAGFAVILTRDRLFGESAGKALKKFSQLSVVILRLPQSRQNVYLKEFESSWKRTAIKPVPGSVIEWP